MAKAASKTQQANLQVVELKPEEKVIVLPEHAPDKLKALKDEQRRIRMEMKDITDALKKQKEAEYEKKMSAMNPKERAAYSIRKNLLKIAGLTKKQDFTKAFGELRKLEKEMEAAAAIE